MKKTVVTINFDNDFGNFSDVIVSNFIGYSQRYNQFTHISTFHNYKNKKDVINFIEKIDPQYVFLPSDYLYQAYAKNIVEKTKAILVFVSHYSELDQLKLVPENRQIGVITPPNFTAFNKVVREILPGIKKIKIIASEYCGTMPDFYSKKLKEVGFELEVYTPKSWEEYVSFTEKSKESELIVPMYPFGIKNKMGTDINHANYQNLITSQKTPTLSVRPRKGVVTLFSLGQSPEKMGEFAAQALSDFEQPGAKVSRVTSKAYLDLKISYEKAKKMGLQINDILISSFLGLDKEGSGI